jgi:AcrR family transcriptional regulator
MPKVSDAHREARREQIAVAALGCFAEKGFQRTSMADIIEASGLSAGAIYLHFESKQQIVLTAGRRVLGRRLGDLQAMDGDRLADPVTTLQHLLAGMVDDIIDTRLLIQLWGEATTDPELGSLVTEIFATLREALTRYLTAWATQQGAAEPQSWAETAARGIDPHSTVRQLPCTRPSRRPGMMLCRSDITCTFHTSTPTLVTK